MKVDKTSGLSGIVDYLLKILNIYVEVGVIQRK